MQVSTLCLGTMMFGAWGNPDETDCHQMVDMALDAGVNFVDTADIYDFGVSEEIVGRALKSVATTSSWPPSSTTLWMVNPTMAGIRGGGS